MTSLGCFSLLFGERWVKVDGRQIADGETGGTLFLSNAGQALGAAQVRSVSDGLKQGPREALACDNAWSSLWGGEPTPQQLPRPKNGTQNAGAAGVRGPIPALEPRPAGLPRGCLFSSGRARCRLAGGWDGCTRVGEHSISGHQQPAACGLLGSNSIFWLQVCADIHSTY